VGIATLDFVIRAGSVNFIIKTIIVCFAFKKIQRRRSSRLDIDQERLGFVRRLNRSAMSMS
jgi:hypothetical protein